MMGAITGRSRLLRAAVCALIAAAAHGQTVWYVDQSAVGGLDDGTGWDDAFVNLQSALARAGSGDQIWVARGTYKPTSGASRFATFQIVNGVALYGGFAGHETQVGRRDPVANRTILSGDVGVPGDDTDNSYHVVIGSFTGSTTILDGFTVSDGRLEEASQGGGAGMLIRNGSPRIRNCLFRDNHVAPPAPPDSAWGGAAIYAFDSSQPTLSRCTFVNNAVPLWSGGAVTVRQNCTAALTDCVFAGNTAYVGGAMLIIDNCRVTLTNCLFAGNTATDGLGGAVETTQDCFITLTNCSLVNNFAASGGGAIGVGALLGAPLGSLTVTNSVLWNNSSDAGMGETAQLAVHPMAGLAPVINYTCVKGWTGLFGGIGNHGLAPQLLNPAGRDALVGTPDDDLRLGPGSPCIDVADSDADVDTATAGVQPLPAGDLARGARFVDDPDTPDGGHGGPPVVDMGAYEYQIDCNSNGIADTADLAGGTSFDCDGNGIPDECDLSGGLDSDCNGNDWPDHCELEAGTAQDCNDNSMPDECDIAGGLDDDCNSNGIPDACDAAGAILVDPVELLACPGDTAEFTVSAVAGAEYQWKKDGVALADNGHVSGATSATLLIHDVAPADEGSYSCEVTDGCIVVESEAAMLTLAVPVSITQQPLALLRRCNGQTVVFAIGAAGTDVSYVWHKDGEPLVDGGRISGTQTPTLTIADATAADSGSYTCVASDACGGEEESEPGVLEIVGPVFTTDPEDACAEPGEVAVFTASAESSLSVAYRWKKDGALLSDGGDISGARTDTLTIRNVAAEDAGAYSLLAFTSDPVCITESLAAELAVGACCETASACPTADVNCDGIADSFDIAVIRNPANWFQTADDAADRRADVNGDAIIDGFDIASVRRVVCWLR